MAGSYDSDDPLEMMDEALRRAVLMESQASKEHGVVTFLDAAGYDEIHAYQENPQNPSANECFTDAKHFYSWAEEYYLEAASLYYNREVRSPGDDVRRMVQKLPSPLREELVLLREDYIRDARALAADVDRLDRRRDYIERLAERVGEVIDRPREPKDERAR
jgi:hypothetical protein